MIEYDKRKFDAYQTPRVDRADFRQQQQPINQNKVQKTVPVDVPKDHLIYSQKPRRQPEQKEGFSFPINKQMIFLILIVVIVAVSVFLVTGNIKEAEKHEALIALDTIFQEEKQMMQNRYDYLNTSYILLSGNHTSLQSSYDSLLVNHTELEDDYDSLSESYSSLEDDYDELVDTEDAYHLHDPTKNEVISFILDDDTDNNDYTEDYFCIHFASDLKNNAVEQGIRCGVMYFYYLFYNETSAEYEEYGHSIVAFDTVDAGMVYVDNDDYMYDDFTELEDMYVDITTYSIAW